MTGFNFTSDMINEGVIVNCLYQFLSVPFAVFHWSYELQCTSCIGSALVRKRPSEYRNLDQVNRTMVRGLGLSKYRNSGQLNGTTTRCPSENRFAFSSYSSSSLCAVKDPKSLSGWGWTSENMCDKSRHNNFEWQVLHLLSWFSPELDELCINVYQTQFMLVFFILWSVSVELEFTGFYEDNHVYLLV